MPNSSPQPKRPAPRPANKPTANRPPKPGKSPGKPGSPDKAKAKSGEQQQRPGRKKPVGVREELAEIQEVGRFRIWLRERFRETPAWLVSTIVHAVVLVLLALVTLAPEIKDTVQNLIATNQTEEETEEIE